ncbi:MAG TPA: hypothetical protein VIF10_17985 [Methylobacter sp.]|jgi:hypothetical protein
MTDNYQKKAVDRYPTFNLLIINDWHLNHFVSKPLIKLAHRFIQNTGWIFVELTPHQ